MKKLYYLYKYSIYIVLTIFIIIFGLYTYSYLSPAIDLNSKGTYTLYDNNEEIFFKGTSQKEWVSLDDISNDVINATLSIEDKNFYDHNGFDYLRIIKSFINNLVNRKIVEGASTISMQYVRNVYLDFEQTYKRKIKEAFLTMNLETHYDKDTILEAYLNTINYGNGNFGIKNAAQYYFNKKPSELSLEESIILAGIPKSPANYNPSSNYDNSIKRAKLVALSMLNNKYITNEEYNNLFDSQIQVFGKKEKNLNMIMYYQDAALHEVKNILGNNYKNEGLKIYTTLDYVAQSTMEKEIYNNTEDTNLQVASVIVNPNNGEVLALTGGFDYSKSTYNRALYSKRQVGSTMKPFLYYAGLENGMTESSTFTSQYTTFRLSNNNIYAPTNYGNVYGNKEITMAAAIAYSDNIYAVKTNLFLGTETLVEYAHKAGIKGELKNVASLALGTSEINLLDFASGYTTFASGGYKKDIHFIKKIEDENGNIIYEKKNTENLVLNPSNVFILNEILTSTMNPAFIDYNVPTALGLASKLNNKYALKTGTTDYDYWTVGYNKNILMIIWTGYDDNSPLSNRNGNNTKKIWANTLNNINYERENSWYIKPDNVIGVVLDSVSGQAVKESAKASMFYFIKGSEP